MCGLFGVVGCVGVGGVGGFSSAFACFFSTFSPFSVCSCFFGVFGVFGVFGACGVFGVFVRFRLFQRLPRLRLFWPFRRFRRFRLFRLFRHFRRFRLFRLLWRFRRLRRFWRFLRFCGAFGVFVICGVCGVFCSLPRFWRFSLAFAALVRFSEARAAWRMMSTKRCEIKQTPLNLQWICLEFASLWPDWNLDSNILCLEFTFWIICMVFFGIVVNTCRLYIHIFENINLNIQVVPGRAGGGSFTRKKNYIAKKEFAYKMCARRPTSAMPKPFLCCERAFWCSMVVMWPVLMHVMSFDVVVMSFDAMWLLVLCHVTWCNAMSCDVRSCDVPCNGHVVCSKWFCDDVVIQSTILYYKVLLCTTKYYSSTTLYYTVLLQYYSVLQSTTPVLVCTAKYYSNTTLYYKVLLQYYSVLHSTTTYYSRTTLYCKVLLQYYSVLQSSIHYWSLTHMNRYLHCAEQQESSSNSTKYCTCHAKCISWLIRVTYETSFRMRGASNVNLQPQQILRLPHKMNLMFDPRLIWNFISNAQSKQCQPPTSANTAPATKSLSSRLQRELSEFLSSVAHNLKSSSIIACSTCRPSIFVLVVLWCVVSVSRLWILV